LAPFAPRAAYAEEPFGGSTSQRLSRLPGIVAELRSADVDAERHRELQHDAVRHLRRAGLLGLRVPARYGGPGGSVRDVLGVVIQIARGSSNVAQALRAHFGFSERLLSKRATETERRQWFPHVNAGSVFGNAITDAHGQGTVEHRHHAARGRVRRASAQRLQVLLHRNVVRRSHRRVRDRCRGT
jgi:alkylation response protein AidB-like acyl-CoA dehydrogenase